MSNAKRKPAEQRTERAAIHAAPTPTPTTSIKEKSQPEVQTTRVIRVNTEFDDDGASAIANALRLASCVYRALARDGFISPTEPRTQRLIAAPMLLATRIEQAMASKRGNLE